MEAAMEAINHLIIGMEKIRKEVDELKQNKTVKQDSYTVGSAAKGGAIKLYFDLSTISDEEAVKLVNRARGIYIDMCPQG